MADSVANWMAHLRGIVQKILPLAVLAICSVLLWPHVQALDGTELRLYWQALDTWQWISAAIFTAISFWAVSQYDVLANRQLGTGLDAPLARRSAFVAIAVAQTTGFGLVVSTLVRWRMLSGFGPSVAAQITAFVSLMFLAALAAMTALACLFLPVPGDFTLPALAVLLLVAALACGAVLRPRFKWRGHVLNLPTLRAMTAAFGWAFIDVFAAAAAFYVLFPPETAPPLLAFLPVFCLALSAGLFSGTPGGVGPFEITLLALTATGLPAEVDVVAVVVAIFGFRLIYFAIPAAIAAMMLVLPRASYPLWRDPPPPSLARARRAETAVIAQTGGTIDRVGSVHCATWQTGQALVAMFDPFDIVQGRSFFDRLEVRAMETNRLPCIYKCAPRTAAAARAAGWTHLHLADDAMIDLDDFTLDSSARSGLRRKLRKSDRAGVQVRRASPHDYAALAQIDAVWQAEHGTARGGTMGRFCPEYLSAQAVFVAECDGTPVAFASFHVLSGEWALDVMRHTARVPDGTMHALVVAGIEAAQRAGAPRLSLSAVIACPDPASAFWRWVAFKLVNYSGGTGLRQFKSSFAPRWQPLYVAAPDRLSLTISLFDIAREVIWPVALSASTRASLLADMNARHNEDEDYEVASSNAA